MTSGSEGSDETTSLRRCACFITARICQYPMRGSRKFCQRVPTLDLTTCFYFFIFLFIDIFYARRADSTISTQKRPLSARICLPYFVIRLKCAFPEWQGEQGTRGVHDRGTRKQTKGESKILRGSVNKYNIGEQGT